MDHRPLLPIRQLRARRNEAQRHCTVAIYRVIHGRTGLEALAQNRVGEGKCRVPKHDAHLAVVHDVRFGEEF